MFKRIQLSFIVLITVFNLTLPAQEFDYAYHRMMADSIAKMSLLNSPEISQQEYELKIKEEKIRREKMGWLSSFKMGLQFLSIDQNYNAGTTSVGILPSLGVSLQIDFERFFTTPSNVRSARHESSIIKLEIDKIINTRETRMMATYYDYVLLIEQTNTRFTTLQTIKDQSKLIEERFRNGETDLDTYLNSVSSVDNAKEAFYETKIASEKTLALLENELGISLGDLK